MTSTKIMMIHYLIYFNDYDLRKMKNKKFFIFFHFYLDNSKKCIIFVSEINEM